MPNNPVETTLCNFRFPKPTKNRLRRIVKEQRSKEPDKRKKRDITMTSILVGLVDAHPVNWKA